jgi:anthranilate synthase/aminodeoxychorismate synthase-like glutamine amidotransferase
VRVVIVDNFDSFTHVLAQVLGGLGAEVLTPRNDTSLGAVLALAPDAVVLSPGPGPPERSGISRDVLQAFAGRIPLLGVCLGMQVIAMAAGASIVRAPEPVHGKASPLSHDGRGVYQGLAQRVPVGRYHSLAVAAGSLPGPLRATSWSEGVLMGLRDESGAVEGVQFHPESVLTPDGPAMLANFLQARIFRAEGEAAAR